MSEPITIISSFEVFENMESLSAEDKKLLNAAIEAADKAYAPYSNFKVGAALMLENGKIFTGNNQENAAYPSGLCAERVAIFHAGSQEPNSKIICMAVTTLTSSNYVPVSPCGACRQSMLEYEVKFTHPIRLIMGGKQGKVIISPSIQNLLPLSFSSQNLS